MRLSTLEIAGGAIEERAVMSSQGPSRQFDLADAQAQGAAATLFVCITCKAGEDRPGQSLFEALSARLADEPDSGVTLRAVECLSVCKRPCTVALGARGKWTYVVGDLTEEAHLDDIILAARHFARSADGVVPWRERPLPFRKGVISRTPPLPTL